MATFVVELENFQPLYFTDYDHNPSFTAHVRIENVPLDPTNPNKWVCEWRISDSNLCTSTIRTEECAFSLTCPILRRNSKDKEDCPVSWKLILIDNKRGAKIHTFHTPQTTFVSCCMFLDRPLLFHSHMMLNTIWFLDPEKFGRQLEEFGIVTLEDWMTQVENMETEWYERVLMGKSVSQSLDNILHCHLGDTPPDPLRHALSPLIQKTGYNGHVSLEIMYAITAIGRQLRQTADYLIVQVEKIQNWKVMNIKMMPAPAMLLPPTPLSTEPPSRSLSLSTPVQSTATGPWTSLYVVYSSPHDNVHFITKHGLEKTSGIVLCPPRKKRHHQLRKWRK